MLRHVAATRVRCLSHRTPWFVSPEDNVFEEHQQVPSTSQILPIPEDVPAHLRTLHSQLCLLPYLETSSLRIIRPLEPLPAPPLPFMRTRGSRRKRGGTDAGVGIDMPSYGVWNWFVLAQVCVSATSTLRDLKCTQVKEGTERKGSINTVVHAVHKKVRRRLL